MLTLTNLQPTTRFTITLSMLTQATPTHMLDILQQAIPTTTTQSTPVWARLTHMPAIQRLTILTTSILSTLAIPRPTIPGMNSSSGKSFGFLSF
jgi:hypothetical protein